MKPLIAKIAVQRQFILDKIILITYKIQFKDLNDAFNDRRNLTKR